MSFRICGERYYRYYLCYDPLGFAFLSNGLKDSVLQVADLWQFMNGSG